MASTDRELFRLIAGKNERAFNKIYHTYHPVLFSCVKRMLKNDSYAKDIVQEVFIQLWEGGDQLKAIQNPGGWLRQLAANRTINYLKKEARARQVLQLLQQRADFTPGDAEINFRELQAILNKVIMKLPIDTGIILRAAVEKGLSRKQIAEELDLPVSTYTFQVRDAVFKEYLIMFIIINKNTIFVYYNKHYE